MDILRLLVSMDKSTGGKEFNLIRLPSGSGLCYPHGIAPPGEFEESDFHQLRRENLITLTRVQRNVYAGKPTQRGITLVQRGFASPNAYPVKSIHPRQKEYPAAHAPDDSGTTPEVPAGTPAGLNSAETRNPVEVPRSAEAREEQIRAALKWVEEELAAAFAESVPAILGDPKNLAASTRALMLRVFDAFARHRLSLVSDDEQLRKFYLPALDRVSKRVIEKTDAWTR
jgi:hypothetical protein